MINHEEEIPLKQTGLLEHREEIPRGNMTQRRIGNKETVDLKKDPQLPVAVEAAEKSLKKDHQLPVVEEAAEKSLKKGSQLPVVAEAAEKADLITRILSLSLQQQLDLQQ